MLPAVARHLARRWTLAGPSPRLMASASQGGQGAAACSYRALVFDKPGEPLDVLSLRNLDLKAPGPGEVEVMFLQVGGRGTAVASLRKQHTGCYQTGQPEDVCQQDSKKKGGRGDLILYSPLERAPGPSESHTPFVPQQPSPPYSFPPHTAPCRLPSTPATSTRSRASTRFSPSMACQATREWGRSPRSGRRCASVAYWSRSRGGGEGCSACCASLQQSLPPHQLLVGDSLVAS